MDNNNDSTAHASVDSRTQFIEQIFQKVEEESERRALEQQEYEEEQARQSRVASPAPHAHAYAYAPAAPAAVSVVVARDRRRGSISVSRFGQATDLAPHTHDNTSALPSRTNSIIINAGNTGAFYQAQPYAGSADSFASSLSSSSYPHGGRARSHADAAEDRDVGEEQVTQMATIAGKVSLGKAVGGIIARRLSLSRSRTRSRDILASPAGLVIGVSVEEATTEAEVEVEVDDADADDTKGAGPRARVLAPGSPFGTSFVYAQADGRRSRRSTLSMPGSSSAHLGAHANGSGCAAEGAASASASAGVGAKGVERRLSAAGWVAKAKDLTKKFRRRSMAVLPQNSSP
ncbi:hypothetical protein BD414DRAFT_538878 [Trametes punicea]|nr:hypothetical protein BD414DRAFT_538878 [Trametes punicea]